jgi:hypothetical protein
MRIRHHKTHRDTHVGDLFSVKRFPLYFSVTHVSLRACH